LGDQFAKWYTPIVVLLAIGIAAVPPLVANEPFQPWLYKALVLLVIACPCALVISTPVTIVSGLAAAARNGILVKGGVHLERARLLRMLALDKTGTLTEGKPELVEVIPMNGASKDEVLRLAASLEATSTHPLAQAVVRGWKGPLSPVTDAKNIVGKGLEGVVDGTPVTIGSHRLAEERRVCNAEVEKHLATLEAAGASVMVGGVDGVARPGCRGVRGSRHGSSNGRRGGGRASRPGHQARDADGRQCDDRACRGREGRYRRGRCGSASR